MEQVMNSWLNGNVIEKDYQKAQDLRCVCNCGGIVRNLQSKIFGCEFHFFGSRVMGLATDESDIDIFVSYGESSDCCFQRYVCSIPFTGDSYYDSLPPEKIKLFINLLERKMRMDPQWTVKLVVRDWHTSFIRGYFKPDQIMVDISFKNGLAVEHSEMMSHLFDVQPDAAKFFLLMKRWCRKYQGEMKSYSLLLLVIFFLQQRNLFPTFKSVQSGVEKLCIGGNVDTIL
jgi:hypothetical protein